MVDTRDRSLGETHVYCSEVDGRHGRRGGEAWYYHGSCKKRRIDIRSQLHAHAPFILIPHTPPKLNRILRTSSCSHNSHQTGATHCIAYNAYATTHLTASALHQPHKYTTSYLYTNTRRLASAHPPCLRSKRERDNTPRGRTPGSQNPRRDDMTRREGYIRLAGRRCLIALPLPFPGIRNPEV